jgi:hypothetical protein
MQIKLKSSTHRKTIQPTIHSPVTYRSITECQDLPFSADIFNGNDDRDNVVYMISSRAAHGSMGI